MSLPIYLRSTFAGAPVLTEAAGSINALLNACLVNGFNTQSVVSATASGGVVTFNFASAPGFAALDTVTIAGASNGTVNGQKRVQSAAGNQVLVAIAGVPDGAVGGTITLKYSPLGWSRPYSGTNLGAYRQGGLSSHKRFVRVYDGAMSSTSRYSVRGYEAMTAISSGTGPYPTTAEVAGNGVEIMAPHGAASAFPWLIVGTPRQFYLMTAYGDYWAYYDANQGQFYTVRDTGVLFFGDLARIRKAGDTYAQVINAGYSLHGAGVYGSRASTGASGSRPAMSLKGPNGSTQSSWGANYPDPVSGNLDLSDAQTVTEYFSGLYGVRGNMPGMLCPWQDAHAYGTPNGTIFTGITGVSGRALLMAGYDIQEEFFLMLDEDWGDV